MTLPYHTGKAARNGITAAELAARGYTASEEVLEAGYGFCELFNGAGNYDLAAVTDHLGAPFDVIEPGISYKYYPCCGLVHSALDALMTLRDDPAYDPGAVEEIRADFHYLVPRVMNHDEPQSGYEAKFSLPYCLAVGAAYGRPTIEHFTDEALRDGQIRRLMGRVRYSVHPDLQTDESITREFSEVVVRIRGGRELARRVLRRCNKGSAELPLTDDELARKFRECAGRAFSRPHVEALLERIGRLADEEDVAGLAALLAGDSVGA